MFGVTVFHVVSQFKYRYRESSMEVIIYCLHVKNIFYTQ